MRYTRADAGLALAIVASMMALMMVAWPAAPQAQEFGSAQWFVLSTITGGLFLGAAFIVDRFTMVARGLLVLGAVARIVSGLIFGRFSDLGALTTLFDVLPALLAIAAAAMIGPVVRTYAAAGDRHPTAHRDGGRRGRGATAG